jgi:hypothetical protein
VSALPLKADILERSWNVRADKKRHVYVMSGLPPMGGNYSFVISFMVITPSSRSAVNETLSPGFKVPNIRAS